MATFVATHPTSEALERARPGRDRRFRLLMVSALTLLAFAVQGYHPYADDGGLYIAGVKHLLDPGLYPYRSEFVLEPMRFSLFALAVAEIVRWVPIPRAQALPIVLLGLHLASLWATLFAAWMLAKRGWPNREAQAGAVTLLACWLGLPIAGTALMFMDPYLTARSLSTPCMILALVGAIDWTGGQDGGPSEVQDGMQAQNAQRRRRGLLLLIGSIFIAGVMHPLMAAYALGASLLLLCLRSPRLNVRRWTPLTLCITALLLAWGVQSGAPPESAAYVHIAATRSYWFAVRWRWYELFGLAAPLLILAKAAVRSRRADTSDFWWGRTGFSRLAQSSYLTALPAGLYSPDPSAESSGQPGAMAALARMAIAAGSTAILIALLLARPGTPNHLLARMQPLRIFQIVYLVLMLLLGAWLGESVLRRSAWRWGLALLLLSGPMLGAARASYSHSAHIEVPEVTAQNLWVQAFDWIRMNTPNDALFAIDADYINAPGEDAQCFRAIAARSVLADYSKDGGEASIAPALTEAWTRDQAAQSGLNAPAESDAERLAALRPLGVSWVVLGAQTHTAFDCPYRNAAVSVCSLP